MKEDRFKFRFWWKGGMCYGPAMKDGDLGLDGDYVLMQCTGLKDKNGKLIWEGDVLRIEGGTFVKSYHLETVIWEIESSVEDNNYYRSGFTISEDRVGRIEVVGNIYENPEKLEGQ